jgi:hypothetical protein
MCGRARLSSDVSEIRIAFGIPPERPTPNIAPSWNVAPTDSLPIVRYDAKDHQRSLEVMRWGLVPFWAKDIKVGFANINAKAEGIENKPAFREAFRQPLFLTLPTRALTGQQVMASEGKGASRDFSRASSAGCSPSHSGHASGARIAGIRLCSAAHSSFGSVVMIAKLRTRSPAGERQLSHSPASAISLRSAKGIA